jgi:hypothetical protein
MNFECLPHPPYSPDLATSDYNIFELPKEAISGKTFRSYEEVQVHEWLRTWSKEFFSRGIQALVKRWRTWLEHSRDYVEK